MRSTQLINLRSLANAATPPEFISASPTWLGARYCFGIGFRGVEAGNTRYMIHYMFAGLYGRI